MVYRKKISDAEARRGYILVSKNMLKQFPPLGEIFTLRIDGRKFRAQLTANPCNCVGSWHDHYHIEAKNLKDANVLYRGCEVVISETDQIYELSVPDDGFK